jgi:hypothetical protein
MKTRTRQLEIDICVTKASQNPNYFSTRKYPNGDLLWALILDAYDKYGDRQSLCVVNDQPVGNPKRKV